MYGWCSSLIHGVVSTKSHPVFIHKPDSSSFPPSLHPPFLSLLASPSAPIFTCCCHQGNRQFKKLLLGNGRQYPASSREEIEGERERRREGRIERERESFQSVNKALLLPSNQPWPPPPPTSSLFAGKTGWPWKVHSKRAITADYYGVSPAVVIMVIWWEGLHHSKTSLDARAGHRQAFEWPAMVVLSINLYYHYNTIGNQNILSGAETNQYARRRSLAPSEMLERELHAFSKGSLTMLSL